MYSRLADFLHKIQRIQSLMTLVSTGQAKEDEYDDEYKNLYSELARHFTESGLANPNPFRSLGEFYGYYRTNLPTWKERRTFIKAMYDDTAKIINKALESNKYGAEDVRLELLPSSTLPLELIVADTLQDIGYEMVESNLSIPSGSQIDFVMKRNGKSYGVEVKSRKVELDDLRGAIDVRSNVDLDNFLIVSKTNFDDDVREMARRYEIELKTTDDILKEMEKAKISTQNYKTGITGLLDFQNNQPTPDKLLLVDYRRALEDTFSATTNDKKKRSLERLGTILVRMIKGLDIIRTNVVTETEEIDILVKNESEAVFWRRLPNPFLIECKNWSKPVDADTIRSYKGKIPELNFRILIALNGITGKTERDDARGVIRDARKRGHFIVVLDKTDLQEIAKGVNPAERINTRYYELFQS